MKKTISIYILIIIAVSIMAIFTTVRFEMFSYLTMPKSLHIFLEALNLSLMFLISASGYKFYKKTGDERYLIFACGIFISMLFESVHVFTVPQFPYDNLSFANIKENPTLIYLMMSNLLIPLTIYTAFSYKVNNQLSASEIRTKIIGSYIAVFLTLSIIPVILYQMFPLVRNNFFAGINSLEYVSYALMIIIATILTNIENASETKKHDFFTIGLFILGLGGLFYINPLYLPRNAILAHLFSILGSTCLLIGVGEIQNLTSLIRIKDELVAYLSILLIAFYVAFVSVSSGVFDLVFPQIAGYLFVEFLLIFQLIVYAFSTISWNKIANIYISAERDRAIIRILTQMRRINKDFIIKNQIFEEINKDLKPDKCFIALYDKETKTFSYDKFLEKLPSKTLSDNSYLNKNAKEFEHFCEIFNNNIEMNFSNVNQYLEKTMQKNSEIENFLNEKSIKSYYAVPIKNYQFLIGYLIVIFTRDYKTLNDDDLIFLKKLAEQIAIAIENSRQL